MTKQKLPIIIAVAVVALLGGAYASGMIGGGKDPNAGKKHVVAPVKLANQEMTVNLKDTDRTAYAVIGLAIQLEPMDAAHYANWSGANAGGHGGSGEAPGPAKLAEYPKFYDAVIDAAIDFTSEELNTASGRQRFKEVLLDRFAKIAEVDEAEHKASPEDPTHVGIDPPYHVMDITFTKLATQAN